MKKLGLVILITLFFIEINAQKINIQWQKCIGSPQDEMLYSGIQTLDGGFVFAGTKDNNKSALDYWIVKTDANCVIEWEKTYGGSKNERANSIIQAKNGDYIVSGWTFSDDGDVKMNYGDCDCWIIRLNSSGDLIKQNTFGDIYSDGLFLAKGENTSDNGYITIGTGCQVKNEIIREGIWIVKFNNSDEIIWNKFIAETFYAKDIIETPKNEYLIVGWAEVGNDYKMDGLILKISKNGELLWEKKYGGELNDKIISIKKINDSEYIAAGWTEPNEMNRNYWLVKFNPEGNIIWQKTFGGSDDDIVTDIELVKGGGFIISGWTRSEDGDIETKKNNHPYFNPWIIRTNEKGELQSQIIAGGLKSDYIHSISITSDGGFILTGETSSKNNELINNGKSDGFIIRIK